MRENIRKRPGMYVGSTSVTGVYNSIFGLLTEIIVSSKKADICISITLKENDTVILSCNPAVEINNSLSLEVIKALSTNITDNWGCSSEIIFQPDKAIFSYEHINYYMLLKQTKELAQLNENVKIILTDNENRNVLKFHNGLESILNENMYLQSRKPLNIKFVRDDVEVEASMIYGYKSDVRLSYVNNSVTVDGGTHVQGLYDGIFYAFKNYIKKHCDKNIKIIKKDVTESLSFVISIRLNDPQFEGAVKRKLTNKEISSIVRKGIMESLQLMLEENRQFLDDSRVIQKAKFRNIL